MWRKADTERVPEHFSRGNILTGLRGGIYCVQKKRPKATAIVKRCRNGSQEMLRNSRSLLWCGVHDGKEEEATEEADKLD